MQQKIKNSVFFVFILIVLNIFSNAQPFQIDLLIDNQPDNTILFGWIQGDNFNFIDSTRINISTKKVSFVFPADAHPGTYRMIFGKTAYARFMDEDPQQLDIIFNNENIELKTDFKSPMESLTIIKSYENKIWFDFLRKDQLLISDIRNYEQLVNQYWNTDEAKAIDAAGKYNQLQLERDVFIKETTDQHSGSLASVYIENQRKPLLDGFLSKTEREEFYRKNLFQNLNFTDERLINSSIYSDLVFEYLTHFNQPDFTKKQREDAYIEAVDMIFPKINKNETVFQFLISYVANGFKILQLEKVIDYLKMQYNYKE